jgi:hypothetical protein
LQRADDLAKGGGNSHAQFLELNAKYLAMARALLSADQRKDWEKLIGEPFQIK